MESTSSVSKGVFVFKNGPSTFSTKSSKPKQKLSTTARSLNDEFKSQKWYQTYMEVWTSIASQIKKLQETDHKNILKNLMSFIAQNLTRRPLLLPTIAILTGVNQPDHLNFFESISTEVGKLVENSRSVILQARDCTSLKVSVETIVYGLMNDKLDSNDVGVSLPKSRYSIETLKSWFDDQQPKPLLIVFIPDFELFNSKVLEDFLMIMSSNFPHLPFVLILGIATELNTLHRTLPHHVTRKLNLQVSQSLPCQITLANILEKVFLSSNCPVKLSSKTFTLLTDIFLFHDMSISSFVQGFKYCIMEHYYQKNWMSICTTKYETALENVNTLSIDDLENIRRLPSFRPLIESLTDSRDVIAYLTDDKYFVKQLKVILQQVYTYFNYFNCFFRVLETLLKDLPSNKVGKELRDLYSLCTSTSLVNLAEFKESYQLISFMSTVDFCNKMMNVVNTIEQYVRHFCRNKDDVIGVECKITMMEIASEIKDIVIAIQNVKDDTDTNREQIKSAKKQLLDYIKNDLLAIYLIPFVNGPPLIELFVFSDLSLVRGHIVGTPRAALDVALKNPQHYLHCNCCVIDNPAQICSTMPDLSIVYKLHLECGHQINLFDWMQAFKSVIDPNEDDSAEISPEIQARFTRAVAELEFLGFIKSSKKKTDHVTRLTW